MLTVDLLHKVFEREVSVGAIAILVTDLLDSKLKEKGVSLSSRQKQALTAKVRAADYSNIRIKSWKRRERRDIELDFTASDLRDLEGSLQRLMDRLPEIVESVSDDLSADILKRLRKGWSRQARYQVREEKGFRKRLDRRWSRPFNLLAMLLTIAAEVGDSVNARLRAAPTTHPYTVDVLTRLHARACQVASEALTLLRNGYSDGALARWRTLHEIAVVSLFLSEGGEVLAERYELHDVIESRRAADEYQKCCQRLGYEPMEPAEVETLEQECATLVERFGPGFRERYGWASERLGSKAPTFADIERAVHVDHLRPFYRMASHNVHANPKVVFFNLGLMNEKDILLTGPSNTGLADPGQNTAISIVQATSSLATLDATLDVIVALKLMLTLSDEVGESFVAVQKQLESEVGAGG